MCPDGQGDSRNSVAMVSCLSPATVIHVISVQPPLLRASRPECCTGRSTMSPPSPPPPGGGWPRPGRRAGDLQSWAMGKCFNTFLVRNIRKDHSVVTIKILRLFYKMKLPVRLPHQPGCHISPTGRPILSEIVFIC
jgi:hypothetical protein